MREARKAELNRIIEMKIQIYIAKALNSFTTYQTGATNTHTHTHPNNRTNWSLFGSLARRTVWLKIRVAGWLPGRERAAGVHSFPELRSPKDGLAQPNPVEVSRGDRPSSRSFGGGGGGGGRGPGLTTRTVEKSLFVPSREGPLFMATPLPIGRNHRAIPWPPSIGQAHGRRGNSHPPGRSPKRRRLWFRPPPLL